MPEETLQPIDRLTVFIAKTLGDAKALHTFLVKVLVKGNMTAENNVIEVKEVISFDRSN